MLIYPLLPRHGHARRNVLLDALTSTVYHCQYTKCRMYTINGAPEALSSFYVEAVGVYGGRQ